MSYLIDTCCISELVKKNPDQKVVRWFDDVDEHSLFVSVITFGELWKGIAKLPDSKRKGELVRWVEQDLSNRFKNRIIDVSIKESTEWGRVLAETERLGTPLPAVDALIAATARLHGLTVVTRDIGDMSIPGVRVLNPWLTC